MITCLLAKDSVFQILYHSLLKKIKIPCYKPNQGPLSISGRITNFRLTTHCFFSTKKKACQEKTYWTEVVFEDKNFQFLSSKITSVLKNPFRGRILSVAKNSP